MFKWFIILTFTRFMVAIYAPQTSNQSTSSLPYSAINTEQEEVVPAPIDPSGALPLVLLEISLIGELYELKIPENISKAVIKGGKIVNGTTFSTTGSETQIFFCPKENYDETCLAPEQFQDLQQLQCSKQLIPVVTIALPTQCGYATNGTSHNMAYEICRRHAPHAYVSREVEFYKFCYDKEKQKIMYTTHFITSPRLLKSESLHSEQQLIYPYLAQNGFPTANYEAIDNSIVSESNSNVRALRSQYKVQKLVPSKDMALGTWIKTTYQYVNLELQHKAVFPFWSEINDKVRADAIEMYENGIIYCVRTGVFDIAAGSAVIPENEEQIYNIWVKVIISMSKDQSKPLKGVAIMMNNFLNSHTASPELILLQNKIQIHCPGDLCEDDFKNRVENAGSQVRCCQTTRRIQLMFGPYTVPAYMPVLQISDLIKVPT